MRIGVLLPTRGIVMRSTRRPAAAECWAMARHCDQAGYDAVWVGDSVVAKPRLEPKLQNPGSDPDFDFRPGQGAAVPRKESPSCPKVKLRA